jgi:hypothetical protein
MSTLEINNKLDVFFVFSPFILLSFFCLLSIYHLDLKIVIMSIGLYGMLSLYKIALSQLISDNTSLMQNEQYKTLCTSLNTSETPGSSLAMMSFIFMYTFLPMTVNQNYNFPMILTLLAFIIMEFFYKIFVFKCFSGARVPLMAVVFGLLAGMGWFGLINLLGTDYNNLLYYNLSQYNHVQCTRATDVIWECTEDTADEDTAGEVVADEVVAVV